MSLFVIIGAQAVGKMSVGKILEENINGKLLYNHQTIDLFANYLNYTEDAFGLSDLTRKELFKAFVKNPETNSTDSIIFTLVINFGCQDDINFLHDISSIFTDAGQKVYFIELVTDIETRLSRNVHEERLNAKPSKRNLEFSHNEIIETNNNLQLISTDGQVEKEFPNVNYIKIDNTDLSQKQVVDKIIKTFKL
ncbi:hypothetical protein BG262_04415 [Floricoccus penangensis]|uniref:Shikimate kinase n=1 Tax=Floricoccus penangensis TaxID=1859475 RepID=A0A9Q5P0E7_9LACT|nr:hypothetical protein [Floricoccus penangensis]OFI46265.1 hypothetical protein BG262_04415 [Floricoccus penangensis]